MRICLLTTQDLDADPFPEDDWPCDPRPFLPEAEWHLEVMEKSTAVPRILQLSTMGFDLFFNLCDGAFDETTPGIEVVQALERLGLPFTGSASASYEPSRLAMKRVCHALGIDTPRYVMAASDEDVARAEETLRFPLIVKHPNSYASIDLTEDSRVLTPEDLRVQAAAMIERHTATLIEEYIDGIECTVLVAENHRDPTQPIVYKPIQYEFPEGQSFKHHDMKWVDYGALTCAPVNDPELETKLRFVAAEFFRGMGGTSFGRIDVRIDDEGRLFVLELNSNCGVYYRPEDAGGADLALLHDPAGHEGFTRQLVETALAGHARGRRAWEVRQDGEGRFAIFATMEVAAGEAVVRFEEQPLTLVTRSRVEREWTPRDRSRFDADAWPLSEDVWVMWSAQPDDWSIPRHSCEPNVWFEGLDLVARRDIDAGERITLDYATFRNERMPTFTCDCGSDDCRGRITGRDFLDDAVERYGSHVSDYVRRRRESAVAWRGA